MNPRYHNERFIEKTLMPAVVKKKVVIIGAGPAGIVAAVTASKRGHNVILLEKRNHVGGALHYVAMEHYKEDIKNYLVYLENQLSKSKVDVRPVSYTHLRDEDIQKIVLDARSGIKALSASDLAADAEDF